MTAGSLRFAAALLALTVGLFGCGRVQAQVLQLDISADFNADVVVNDGSGFNDPTQDPIDSGFDLTQNFCFPTQSVANAAAVPPQTPDGLPDSAFFPANAFHPDVQLSWSNDDDGLNAWRLANSTGQLLILVPSGSYLEVHVLATSGQGSCDITLTPSYSDGLGTAVPFVVADWFAEIVPTLDNYYLIDGGDRIQPGSGPGTAYEYQDRDDGAIFGFRLRVDPARLLESVLLIRTDTTGYLNAFGGLVVEASAPEACCFPTGACGDLSPAACTAAGGVPQGPGTDCLGTACPAPEACCFVDGSCSDLILTDCASVGGLSQGPGTDCLGVSCPALGACCFPDGSCADLTAADCSGMGGRPVGPGTDCVGITCPAPEACCLPDGSCLDLLFVDCRAAGGSAQGPGTDCAGTACSVPGIPGWVPDGGGRSGDALVVSKAVAGQLALTWGLGCSPDATDHVVHEGTIGSWYDHEARLCDTAGALVSATITPGAADRYFLVVAITDDDEGSYGLDSFGVERPASATLTCRPTVLLGCP